METTTSTEIKPIYEGWFGWAKFSNGDVAKVWVVNECKFKDGGAGYKVREVAYGGEAGNGTTIWQYSKSVYTLRGEKVTRSKPKAA